MKPHTRGPMATHHTHPFNYTELYCFLLRHELTKKTEFTYFLMDTVKIDQ